MNREEAIKIFQDKLHTMKHGAICCDYGNDKDAFLLAIQLLKQEPKTGHWIERIERDDWDDSEEVWYECNQCHLVSERASNYCPNCGAKMAESEVQE